MDEHDPSELPCQRPSLPPLAVNYAIEPELSVQEFAAVFRSSTLAERRPVERPDVLEAMLRGADLIVTARLPDSGLLVGVSRAITDFAYCTYLSDLAVDARYQRRGIGKELLRRTHEAAGLHTTLILLAAPRSRDYYPHIGMKHHDSCWLLPRYAPPFPLPPNPKCRRRAGSAGPAGDRPEAG
ncbi:MAG: GNAT family N-acetyltransferase [Tepidisphaerales bacterium]